MFDNYGWWDIKADVSVSIGKIDKSSFVIIKRHAVTDAFFCIWGKLFDQRTKLFQFTPNFVWGFRDVFVYIFCFIHKIILSLISVQKSIRSELKIPTETRLSCQKITMGAVVEDVRTVFERRSDATIYIPTFDPRVHYILISNQTT